MFIKDSNHCMLTNIRLININESMNLIMIIMIYINFSCILYILKLFLYVSYFMVIDNLSLFTDTIFNNDKLLYSAIFFVHSLELLRS